MDPITAEAVPVAAQAGLSTTQISFMLGPILSHVARPIAAKIPEKVRPLLLGAAAIVVGAYTASMQGGVTFKQALSQGIAAAFAMKLYHLGVLQDGSPLAALVRRVSGTPTTVNNQSGT